jgi:hypothetical protein
MPLSCNIDAKGKALRLVMGMVDLGIAAMLAFNWAWPRGSWLPWASCGLIAAFGAFQIFEGWSGWCALRAMGFKTRL